MIELGQPMHAFDLAEINGGVRVRMAEDGEAGPARRPGNHPARRHLVIADHQRALAIAGVMGGEHSGVSDSTRDLFLEARSSTPSPWPARARSMACTPTPRIASSAASTASWRAKAMDARPPDPRHRRRRAGADRRAGQRSAPADSADHPARRARDPGARHAAGRRRDRAPLQALELTVVADGEGSGRSAYRAIASTFPWKST